MFRLAVAALVMLTATGAAPRPPDPAAECVEAVPLSASRCRRACGDCKQRCSRHREARDRRDCEMNCYDVNAACCEANSQRPWFRSCGCH